MTKGRIANAIVAFGEDADGEPLIVDYGGGFHRMERREPDASSAPFRSSPRCSSALRTPTLGPSPNASPSALC